jgi:hypothetical protein
LKSFTRINQLITIIEDLAWWADDIIHPLFTNAEDILYGCKIRHKKSPQAEYNL